MGGQGRACVNTCMRAFVGTETSCVIVEVPFANNEVLDSLCDSSVRRDHGTLMMMMTNMMMAGKGVKECRSLSVEERHACISIDLAIHTYIYVDVHTYIHICIYIHIYICTVYHS